MEKGPWLKVSSDRLMKLEIKPVTRVVYPLHPGGSIYIIAYIPAGHYLTIGPISNTDDSLSITPAQDNAQQAPNQKTLYQRRIDVVSTSCARCALVK